MYPPRNPETSVTNTAFWDWLVPMGAVAMLTALPFGRPPNMAVAAAQVGTCAAVLLFKEAMTVQSTDANKCALIKSCYYTAGFLLLLEVRFSIGW
jgi:hypothetical protein